MDRSTPIINQHVALVRLEKVDQSLAAIERIGEALIARLKLKVVNKVTHSFHPTGVTLAYILSESHLLIHTWPELGVVHVDLVTCVDRSRKEFEESLEIIFAEQEIESIEIKSVNFD